MRPIHIDFMPHNIDLLVKGLKTTTLRTDSQANQIGMSLNEVCKLIIETDYGDYIFKVCYVGKVSKYEVPDIWSTEGFDYTNGHKFYSTKEFMDGKRLLHLYRLERINA